MQLTELSIADTAAAYRKGELSPIEVAEAHLAAIERLNPCLNAYLTVTGDEARAQARVAAELFRLGEDHGPLQGIPLSLKDLYDIRGVRTTAGSIILSDNIAASDSAVVERLRAQHAVLLGKTHMHEWALGITTVNPHFGACHNPWDLDRIAGGSSGGSAAALAAGLCQGSFGSDTGGSIRIPAALCGIVGLKPTRGRVSLRGVIPLSWSLDHAGPMARTVCDAAILLQAVAGYDPGDPGSVPTTVDDYLAGLEKGPAGLRLLVPESLLERSDAEISAPVRAAIGHLESLGAHAEPLNLPGIEELSGLNGQIIVADAAAYHAAHLADRSADIGTDVLTRLRVGEGLTAPQYARLRQEQRIWRRALEQQLAGDTLLILPATPAAAIPIAGSEAVTAARRFTSLTGLFDFTGLPALSIPCGFTADGLPIGLQLVGRPWAEALLLRAANAYEATIEWHRRRPALVGQIDAPGS